MRWQSVQTKIGGTLIIILLLTLGISFTLSTFRSLNLLEKQQQSAIQSAHNSAQHQAKTLYESLEVGTGGSLERGEMDVFDELLTGLGKVPGVLEVGLTDPNGKILYSSQKGNVGRQNPDMDLSDSGTKVELEKSTQEKFFMARGQIFQQRCLECHDEARVGSLAGILYVDYSMEKMQQEKKRQNATLQAATSASVSGNLLMASLSIIITWLALFFLLRKMIVRPIIQVKNVLHEIGHGHLEQRLNLTQQDELGDMGRTLDELSDSLQHEVVEPLQQLAAGDLTFKVAAHDQNDKVRSAIKQVGDELNTIIAQLQSGGDQISSASGQVADSSQTLSQSATETAASLEEISSSINEMASQTTQSATNANQANQLAGEASRAAANGGQQMSAMVAAMSEINEAGQNISKIIKTIDEIAFQTNLLALNAAVEAARAGQHGKGFAVVAEEVRNLAARSAKAASETAELIEGSVEKTRNGTQIAEQTSAALNEIVGSISKVTDLVAEIAAASNEQAQGIAQINQGLGQIDQGVQQNTATAEESAAAAEELSSQAAHMKQMLGRFTLATGQASFSSPPLAAPSTPAATRPNSPPAATRPNSPPAAKASLGWGESPTPAGKPKPNIQLDDDEFGKY